MSFTVLRVVLVEISDRLDKDEAREVVYLKSRGVSQVRHPFLVPFYQTAASTESPEPD